MTIRQNVSTMKKISKISLIGSTLSLLALSGYSTASSLEVDINADAIKAKYNLNSKRADYGISVAALVTDDNGEAFSADIVSQGLLKNNGNSNIRGGFGLRAYHVSPDGDSFQALALGGFAELGLMPDLSLGVDFFYAPSITLTDDLDSLHELNFRISYQLFENARIYGGMRDFEVSYENFDFDIDDEIHAGFMLDF